MQYFNQLRMLHFPKHINYLDAHLTLFHHLPADEPLVDSLLADFAQHPVFRPAVTGIHDMGRGVAFTLSSAALQLLHAAMQASLSAWLIPQDRHRLWPHITIQNRVTAFKAAQLAKELRADFQPFSVTATGLEVWRYEGGPWQHMRSLPFT